MMENYSMRSETSQFAEEILPNPVNPPITLFQPKRSA